MATLEKTLLSGEEVVVRGSLSPLALYGDYALIALALGLVVTGAILGWTGVGIAVAGVGGVVLLLGLGRLGRTTIRRRSTEMVVTNRRVLIRTGVLSKETDEMFLNKVESVEVEQSLWERIVNVGTVLVHGSGEGRLEFAGIAAPHDFRKACLQAVEQNASSKGGSAPVAVSPVFEVQVVDTPGAAARWIEVRAGTAEQAKQLAAATGVQAGEARLKRIG